MSLLFVHVSRRALVRNINISDETFWEITASHVTPLKQNRWAAADEAATVAAAAAPTDHRYLIIQDENDDAATAAAAAAAAALGTYRRLD